jgi:tetratricopeptide (TPR) repeat protein
MPEARGRGSPIHDGERLTVTAPHIPEPDLALLASDPDAIAPDRTLEIHMHLARCTDCADTYDSFVAAFAGEDDETFLASDLSVASLEYGARVARENADADELLKDYFAQPERAAFHNLASQRKFVHGGVVRRLAKQAFDVCASEPLNALVFADAAIAVAEALPKKDYPPNALHDLRGRAWKERANALNRLGEPAAALDALEHAAREYRKATSNTLGLGNVALIRAAAYFCLERFSEADRELRIAEELYERLGDAERRTKAMFLRGNIKYESRELQDAATLFSRVIAYGEAEQNQEWIASGSYALGNCVLESGVIESAAVLFSTAIRIYRHTGQEYLVGAEWGMARVLLARGLYPESLRRLTTVHAEFTKRGMVLHAAVAALDAMDAMVALRMFKRVADLARAVFKTFTDAGMLTSALTALAFIQTAAAEERLTREQVQAVRRFVKRLEREPNLLFVPPPDEPTKNR